MKKQVKKNTDGFLSARKLGITSGERHWLIETANKLSKMRSGERMKVDGTMMRFSLSDWFDRDVRDVECGTIGCFKGWMGALALSAGRGSELGIHTRETPKRLIDTCTMLRVRTEIAGWVESPNLRNLFLPSFIDYDKVTPRIAANAAYRFLKTGVVSFPPSIQEKR